MDSYRVEWSDSLKIGSLLLDAQHRELVRAIARIPETDRGEDDELPGMALEYAASHFHHEEAFMERVGFPGLGTHRLVHKRLTRTLLSYREEIQAGTTSLYAFKQFMFRWVRDHIMDEDRKIAEYARHLGPEVPGA